MSTPTPEQQTPPRSRRPDPARATHEELLRFYAVDPEIGLSGREAERRRDRLAAKPLFSTTAKPFSQCLLSVLREPVLWIMLAVSVIALFFDRVSLGLVCLVLTAGHTVLCAFLLRRAERINATMQQAYDAPLPRVLRSRRICRIGADNVAPGDILILEKGDTVPADVRLLRADRLAVRERELDATDPNRPSRLLEKDADFVLPDGPEARVSPKNMVYAGGVVESGSAVALAVAVGDRTHLGGLIGSIRPSHGTRPSALGKTTAGLASMISLALVILLIPLIAVGVFTLKDRYEFLDIFLSAVSLSVLGLCEHTVARYAYLAAIIRRDAATGRDSDNTADIRSDLDAERLATVTDVLLLGSAALHDGKPYPTELLVGTETYRCDQPDADQDASSAVDLMYLWQYGRASMPAAAGKNRQTELLAATVDHLVPPLCEWAETDTDAILLKYKDIQPIGGAVAATVTTAEGDHRLFVRLSDTLPTGGSDRFRAAAQTAHAEGYAVLFLMIADRPDEEGSVCAMLTYAPRVCPKTAGWIKGLETSGIHVSALISEREAADARVLAACGLTEHHPVSHPTPDRRIADAVTTGVRAFVGCTDREISDCIADMKAAGRVVAVLSVDGQDIAHLNAADVAITCSPSVYADADADFPRPVMENVRAVADGTSLSDCADDLSRRRADVIVRRTRVTGGGLGGVRTALLAADRMRSIPYAVAGYLFLATAMRLLAVVLSMAFGLLPIPAPMLLFSGYAVDLAVLFALSRIPAETTVARDRRNVTVGLDQPWNTWRTELICTAVTAALPWLVALIARGIAGADFGGGLFGYALLCLMAQQTALYITLRPRRDAEGRKRTDRTYAITLLILVMLYIGTLAVALGTGLHPLYAFLIPPIPAALYIAALAVCKRLFSPK